MTGKPRILAGHKQVGKRFIAPLNQMDLFKETSYVERTMPELLWMDMINVMLDYRAGIGLTMDFCSAVLDSTDEKFMNFAVTSSYLGLAEERRLAAVGRVRAAGLLEVVSVALAPLARTYADFPMSWLVDKSAGDGAEDIERISNTVERIIDKYSYPASIVQANVLAFRAKSGAMFYADHVPVPDFNAMAADFESDAGRRAAAHARMGAMMEIAREESDAWSRSFWTTNYRLTKCGFREGDHDGRE